MKPVGLSRRRIEKNLIRLDTENSLEKVLRATGSCHPVYR